MKIIEPSVEFVDFPGGMAIMKHLEKCGRVCYKSEDKITEDSYEKFLRGIVKRGHEAVLEHSSVTVKFIVDRGVSHEIVRHRMASYCQESQRYCNYSNEKFGDQITVIKPSFLYDQEDDLTLMKRASWSNSCKYAEMAYFDMLELGARPEEARAVLPNSAKTEIVMTANIREWRHFLRLRCSKAAHPQMRQVALLLLGMMFAAMPVLFEDIYSQCVDTYQEEVRRND